MFIEIVRLESDLAVSSQLYQLYGVIKFLENYDQKIVRVLREEDIFERFNMVIMTNKTRRYIQYFLERSSMKSQKDSVILLDDN